LRFADRGEARAIDATPSLAELDPFRMRVSRADALTFRASGKVRTKLEANRLLASLIGERRAYQSEERS